MTSDEEGVPVDYKAGEIENQAGDEWVERWIAMDKR